MVSTFAEIFAEQTGVIPTVQDLTLYQGSAWYPGMHVDTSTYTKAFYAQIRVLASDAAAVITMSSHNGGIKHWGHDFFASDFAAGEVWKTFSLIVHQSNAGINTNLSDKYSQTDSQAGGLLDLFLSAQETAALTFSKAGYDIDMIPLAKKSGATIDTSSFTFTLSNDGTTTIGGIAVGKITAASGAPFAGTAIKVGDLFYITPGTTTPVISLANTWDLVASNSRFYRVSDVTSDTVIEIDRPWPVVDGAGTKMASYTTTGLPLQAVATADIRPWMSAEDDYTDVLLIDGADAGGTKLTFTSATFDLGAGSFLLAVGDIVLITGQEDIVSGEVDISGLQTVVAVTTGAGTSNVTFNGATSGSNRVTVTDIVITKLHEGLITRIASGRITLDDTHAYGY